MRSINSLNDVKPTLRHCFAVLAMSGLVSVAQAATDSTTFPVTISIDGTCTINATDIAFGSVASGTVTPIDAEGTITVNCTLYTPYQIGLDQGLHEDTGNRRMFDGASAYIIYQLYSDAGHATVWGNTLSVNTVDGIGTGVDVSYTVYARVPNTTGATSGGYSDTVTATVTF